MPKRLRAVGTSDYFLQSRSAASYSGLGTMDWSISMRYVSRGAEIYHGPIFYWANESNVDGNPGYRLNILDNGLQFLKDGVQLAEEWGVAPPIGGSEHILRVRGTAGGWEVLVDGVVVMTVADASKYTSGYFGFHAFNTETTVEYLSGPIAEDFEAQAAGDLADGTTIGNWYIIGGGPLGVWSIEQHGAVVYTLTVDPVAAFSVVGKNVNMRKRFPLRVLPPAEHTVTTQSVGLYRHRRIEVSPASVSAAMQSFSMRRTYLMTVNPAGVDVAANQVGLLRHRRVEISSASAAVSANSVGLYRHRFLQVTPGSYAATTYDVILTNIEPTVYTLTINPAAVTVDPLPVNTEYVEAKGSLLIWTRKGRR